MEKRILIAFIMSFAVLYGFNLLFRQQQPAPAVSTNTAASSTAPTDTKTPPAPPATSAAASAVAPQVPETEAQAANEEVVPIKTDLYNAILSNEGGVLKSFTLSAKHYPDDKNRPTELINQPMGEKVGWPLAIVTDDDKLN